MSDFSVPFEAGMEAGADVYDVIVVGAGISGLRCASTLKETFGLKVKVLEARWKVGGRIQEDSTFIPGRQIELGAEFIHGDVNPVVELCEEKGWSRRHIFTWSHGDGGPAEGPAPDGGIGYYWLAKEKRLLRYDDEDPDMKVCNEALWNLGEVDAATAEADKRTLRQYLQDQGVPERMIGMGDAGYGNTAGGTMDTVPVTRAMRYERAWGGDGSELDPDFRMEPSFSVLIDHLANGLDITVNAPVASINVDTAAVPASDAALSEYMTAVERACAGERDCDPSHTVRTLPGAVPVMPASVTRPPFPANPAVTVSTKAGAVLRAHRVVVTVPLPVLRDGDITFNPPLSAAKVAAAKSMSFANGVKVMLKFARRAWPANCHGVVCADSLIPEMWMNSTKPVGGLITGQQCTWASTHTGSVAESWADVDEVGTVCSGGAGAMGAVPGSGRSSTGLGTASDPGTENACTESDGTTTTGIVYSPEAVPEAESGTFFTVTGFIMGVRADAMLASFDQSTIIARVLSQIDEMFGMDALGGFVSGFVHDWSKEEFIRGAYSTPTMKEVPDVARRLAEPHLGAVFFAGEATAGAVEGTERDLPENRVHFAPPIVMHGAMQTGSAAACNVVRSLGFRISCEDKHAHFMPTYISAPTSEANKDDGFSSKDNSLEEKLGQTDVCAEIGYARSRTCASNGMTLCSVLTKEVAAAKRRSTAVKVHRTQSVKGPAIMATGHVRSRQEIAGLGPQLLSQ